MKRKHLVSDASIRGLTALTLENRNRQGEELLSYRPPAKKNKSLDRGGLTQAIVIPSIRLDDGISIARFEKPAPNPTE
jgi:hypothetical protein